MVCQEPLSMSGQENSFVLATSLYKTIVQDFGMIIFLE